MIQEKLEPFLPQFDIISVAAMKELNLLQNLQSMQHQWTQVSYDTIPWEDDPNLHILTNLENVFTILDDHIIDTLKMRASVFVKPIEEDVKLWYDKLNSVQKVTQSWSRAQNNWLQLIPIFGCQYITIEIPAETDLFSQVNRHLLTYLRHVNQIRIVIPIVENNYLSNILIETRLLLDKIIRGIAKFIDKKRIHYPRFYFLGNYEILEVLSYSKQFVKIIPYMKRCFQSVDKVEFLGDKVLGIQSSIGEFIQFNEEIDYSDFNIWELFVNFEKQIKGTLREFLFKSMQDIYFLTKIKWWSKWPEKIIINVLKINWTKECEACFNSGGNIDKLLQTYQVVLNQQLIELVNQIHSDLSALVKYSLMAIYVQTSYFIQVIDWLRKERCEKTDSFHWLTQFRYYWSNNKFSISIFHLNRDYQYEYLGNDQQLVLTPDTERCYRAFIQVTQLNLYACLEGAQISGKSVIFKDLAGIYGQPYYTHNCRLSLSYEQLVRYIKGTIACGAYFCFDDFNYTNSGLKSILAQYLTTITNTIKSGRVSLFGNRISGFGYFSLTYTQLSGSKFYLPNSLKVLFRHFYLTSPDEKYLIEVYLAKHGFNRFKELSMKVDLFWKYCKSMFGNINIRNLKQILENCGGLKLKSNSNEINETEIVMGSILNILLPMFQNRDEKRFKYIVQYFFDKDYEPRDPEIYDSLVSYCKENQIILTESFKGKIFQFFWFLKSNNFKNIIITGDPGSGKTTAIRLLQSLLNVEIEVLFPSLLQPESIFGKSTENLEKFQSNKDNLYANILQNWVIFDGPIENDWFIYLYGINGINEINGKQKINIFETIDIQKVSPNVVAYCGIVHFNSIDWEILIPKYLPKETKENQIWTTKYAQVMPELLRWIIPPSFEFIRKNCSKPVNELIELNIIRNVLQQVQLIIEDAVNNNFEDIKYITSWIQATLYFIFIFNISNILEPDVQIKFNEFYKSLWKTQTIDFTIPLEGLSKDYYYIFKSKGMWKYWPDMIRSPKIEEINLSNTLVPTVNSAQFNYIFELYIKHKLSFILIGKNGSGKSCYIKHLLQNKLPKDCEKAYIHIARKMTSLETQNLYLSKLVKHKRNKFGANLGKKCFTFIDDLHLSIDNGNTPTTELIRQYLNYQFWYDVESKEKFFINDLIILCSLGFIGNQPSNICKRFINHFPTFHLQEIQNESLQKIFTCKLFHNLKANGFPSDVMNIVSTIIQATNYIYKEILRNLKPLPNTILYIFELTDFEKVINGISLIKKTSNVNKKTFPKLWLHEIFRTFYDRIIKPTDQLWFQNTIIEALNEYFKQDYKELFENDNMEDIISNLYFHEIQNQYQEIELKETQQTLITELENYNQKNDIKLNIVIEKYSTQHLLRITRILSFEGGCGLLLGSYGSGRETLTRLAAFILNYDIFTPSTQPEYNLNYWRQDIKKVLLHVGSSGRKTILLIKESYLKNEEYINDLNSLLTLGEIQNMYTVEEQQEVIESTRIAAQQGNRSADVSVASVLQFFINRCKQNLHLMICLSSNTKLAKYLRIYPALINVCIMEYFEPWPSLMYEKIAQFYMKPLEFRKPDVKTQLPTIFRTFNSVINDLSTEICVKTNRFNYITSACFIHFLKLYQFLINKKQKDIIKTQEKYQTGLDKLSFATEQVVLLQKELSNLKPRLIEMGERAAEMRKVIERETIAVEAASQLVREEEKVANVQAAAAQSLKSECEADLALAIPILEDAINALNTLKPTDITLVKSMKNPPDTIKLVMAAVCVIKEIKPDRLPDAATGKKIIDYWGPSKRILGEMNFLQQLKEFDKDNIPPNVMAKIRKEYLPNKDFQPHTVAKASSAAEGLCKWVIAMDLYDKVAKEVAPKKAKLVIAEAKYANTLSILNEKRRKFSELKARLEDLNIKLEEANKDMRRLQNEVDACTKKYQCAQKLVNSLEFEKSYWTETVNALIIAYDDLTGDVLVSSCIIAYLGPFSWNNREKIFEVLNKYLIDLNIDYSKQFNFARLLKQKNETKVIDYSIRNITTDNTTIIRNSKRCCLLVDPQLQMLNWIQEIESELTIIKISDPNILDKMIDNVSNGTPTVISNIKDNIPQSIFPFLYYERIYEKDDKHYLEVNGKDLPYHTNFRLYLTTSLPNPIYSEQVSHYVNIIYCPMTKFTLTDKLLNILIKIENNDLYTKLNEITFKINNYKLALKDLRYNILATLSESKTNILDDETAIQTLDNSKIKLTVIQSDEKNTKKMLKEVNELIKHYKPTAVYGATIYKCLLSLYHLNYLYQYSLNWYENIFQLSIAKSSKSRILETRMKYLMNYLAKAVYYNISRSLFSNHTLIFAFFLYIHTIVLKQPNNAGLLNFLINRYPIESTQSMHEWLSNEKWEQINYISENFKQYQGIKDSIATNPRWKDMYENKDYNIPEEWIEKLTLFEQLLIIKILLPEQVIAFVKFIIGKELGEYFVNPPLFDIGKTYEASIGSYVIVIILPEENNNQNPVKAITSFAIKKGLKSCFQTLSLGTADQNLQAEKSIKMYQKSEYWLCMENLELSQNWVNTKLELLCEKFNTKQTNNNFRLWLITTYTPNNHELSSFILQNSTKVTIDEEIIDLKQTLKSNYMNDPINLSEYYDQCPGFDKIFQKAIFSLCYFYGIMKIRQNYNKLAWTSYPLTDFDINDLYVSLHQIAKYIKIHSKIPISLMKYLTIQCNYGCKILTKFDRNSMEFIFESIFNHNTFNTKLYSCFNDNSDYRLPKKLEYENVLIHIDTYPHRIPPEVYYLHPNDENYYNTQKYHEFIHNIYSVKNISRPSTASQNKIDFIEMFLTNLPKLDEIKQLQDKYTKLLDTLDEIIYSELLHLEFVVNQISLDLIDLLSAVKGDSFTTPDLEDILKSLDKNSLPNRWLQVTQLPKSSTINYLMETYLKRKFQFFYDYKKGQQEFYLPAFQYPKKIFYTLLLQFANKYSISIDSTRVVVTSHSHPDQIYFSGLSCIGAKWNNNANCIEIVDASNQTEQQMPNLSAVIVDESKTDLNLFYDCPIFQTVGNNFEANFNFIWNIQLLVIDYSKKLWMIKRNVFLMCHP